MSSYTPKSMADLQSFILNKQIQMTIDAANEKLNDIVLECFKTHMDEDFYNKYRSRFYPRSYQMRESIGVKLVPTVNGNTVTFGIKFDENMLREDYWDNRGYEGIRYNENGYTSETIMKDILSGNFDEHRNTDIIEEVKRDATMIENIKADLMAAFKKNGFVVK